jgi:transcriptional regulator with XRE-family HTH domain
MLGLRSRLAILMYGSVMELDELIRQRIRSARTERGLSQQALTKLMSGYGVVWHQATVHKIEHGIRAVSASELFMLSYALSIPVHDFGDLGKDGDRIDDYRAGFADGLQAAADAVNALSLKRLAEYIA